MKLIYKILIIITAIILFFLIAVGIFAYRNLTYDYLNEKWFTKKGKKLGFNENIATLEDGLEIYYIEGPNNGPKLLLLHGQQVNCYDYAKVLPKLSKEFHVYALDYYGHGKSSKDPLKYNAVLIGNDIIWFIKNIIKDEIYLSGHSSGALLASYIAATSPESIKALVLEDGPFFSTLPGKAEHTISWLGFKQMHDYFNQDEFDSFIRYSFEDDYMETIFNDKGSNIYDKIIKNPVLKRLKKNPNKVPKIWYFPPSMGVNSMIAIRANLQDGNGEYDLRFGKTFYDFSWFIGYNQEEILKNIEAPTIVMHVAPNDLTKPSYHDKNGILLAAMDEQDAERVVSLIPNSKYIGGFKSSHDIHADVPKEYIKVLLSLKTEIEKNYQK